MADDRPTLADLTARTGAGGVLGSTTESVLQFIVGRRADLPSGGRPPAPHPTNSRGGPR